ncbi:MAG: DUF1573 domain-containing protein [Acidobacteria bacterium]|nr:DUF1573 domain-containing protein [Acidobacteriota bacterium]
MTTLNPNKRYRSWPLLVAVFLSSAAGFHLPLAAALPLQEGANEQAVKPEQVLRVRAQQFYTLLQMRQVTKAETYATKDSRERLRDQASNPFLGFRMLSVQLDPDGKSGKVKVELTVMAPYMGAPMPLERNTQWQLEDGEWRIIVPEPPPEMSLESMMAISPEKKEVKPEELQFKGHSFGLGVMKPGDVKTAAFPFTNVTDHAVTISNIATGCECLQVKTQKMEYKPGESGELVIEFDSTNYEYEYLQSVLVRTDPGDIVSYLRIHAQVVPRNIAFPEKPSEPAAK